MQRAHPVKHFLFWILMTALVAGGYYRRTALSKTAKNARMWHYKANAKVMATFAEVTFWEKDPDYKKGKAGHVLNTKAKVQTTDTAIYSLLTDAQYKFPTVLPDGTYKR